MKSNLIYRILPILTGLSFLISCHNQASVWPKAISSDMWVPKDAIEVHHYELGGRYQIGYKIKACYPSKEFIETMVSEMTRRGWKRSKIDYLNPELKLNNAQTHAEWSYFIDATKKEEENVWQWIDDWEDGSRNIIRYELRFKHTRNSNLNEQKNFTQPETCDLSVNVSYTSAEVRRTIEKNKLQ
jgi:hypothetical protein